MSFRRFSSALLACVAFTCIACVTIGCGDNSGQTFELEDGSTVFVSGSGDITLSVAGRVLWKMNAGRPVGRSFDVDVTAALGIWEFERSDVSEVRFSDYAESIAVTGGVDVRYQGATLRIGSAGENRTSIHLLPDESFDSLTLPFDCDRSSTFFGFGAQYNGTNQRGKAFELWVSEQGIGREGGPRVITGDEHTTYFPMPYFLDARGFGALVETTRRTRVDLCAKDDRVASFEAVGESSLEVTIFHGPTPLDVIEQLGGHIGRPTAPPEWALGVWIGAQGGTAAVNGIAGELEAARIPATALWVQDWTGVRPNIDGGSGVEYRWEVDATHYSDLPAQVAALRRRGYRFLTYANSFIDPDLPNHYSEMAAADLLIKNEAGEPYLFSAPNGQSSLPDLTHPAARAYVKSALAAMVRDNGFDGWMSDFGEWLPTDAVLADGTSALAYHNRFPIEWQTLWREVMDQQRPDGDYAVFARSGFTGVHQFAQIYWIGDQETSFAQGDGLPTVVPAMLNLGLSGIPVSTHDIAGFSSVDGPSDKELYLRWVELGAFTPVMRTHEGNAKEQNWNWNRDDETRAHFARFARIHQALVPELVALAQEAEVTSAPLVRHLILHDPTDEKARDISDQYLLGSSLLVAPITKRGETRREVYLPEGTWFHLWTGERFEGNQRIEIDAPIGAPPVFSLDGDRPELRAIR